MSTRKGSQSTQESRKTAQKGAQMAPESPRKLRDAPGQSNMIQDATNIYQKGSQQDPKRHPRGLQTSQESPKSPRRPTKSITRPGRQA